MRVVRISRRAFLTVISIVNQIIRLPREAFRHSRRIPIIGRKITARRQKKDLEFAKKWPAEANKALARSIKKLAKINSFQFCRSEGFPSLGWSFSLSSSGSAKIMYGRGVERMGDAIFEGVWCGEFTDFSFSDCKYVYGSGLKISDGAVTFTPPSHPFECIVAAYHPPTGEICISNSLANALVGVENRLSDNRLQEACESIAQEYQKKSAAGAFGYDPVLFTSDELVILTLIYHNFTIFEQKITADLRCEMVVHENFDAYDSFVSRKVKQALENGRSRARSRNILEPISCISSGYDSTASTAFGVRHECRESLTLDVEVYGHLDSGSDIAAAFGIACHECSHPVGDRISDLNMLYQGSLQESSLEFAGTVGFGDDIIFLAFEDFLEGAVLIDGKFGDGIWDKRTEVFPGHPVGIKFSKSMNEFRLRKGFAHLPVPAIGAQFPDSIIQISLSREMAPWRIGGSYDRPIPRRIVESAGASRNSFGQRKSATNPNPLNLSDIKLRALEAMMDRYRC